MRRLWNLRVKEINNQNIFFVFCCNILFYLILYLVFVIYYNKKNEEFNEKLYFHNYAIFEKTLSNLSAASGYFPSLNKQTPCCIKTEGF